MNYCAAGCMINVVSQSYTLNKVSFTETQTKQSYTLSSWRMRYDQGSNPIFPLEGPIQYSIFTSSVLLVTHRTYLPRRMTIDCICKLFLKGFQNSSLLQFIFLNLSCKAYTFMPWKNSLTVFFPNPQCELLLLRKIHLRLWVDFSSANKRLSGNKNKFCFEINSTAKGPLFLRYLRKRFLFFYFSWQHLVTVFVSRKVFCHYHAWFGVLEPPWAPVIHIQVSS